MIDPKSLNPDFIYKTQIKEKDLDTLGHVNNAKYLELFEEARWDFITENGFGIDYVKKVGQSPVVLEITIRFKKELKNREYIEIHSIAREWREKIGKISQYIVNQAGQIACEAEFTVGFFDLRERKLVSISPEFQKAITPKV